MNNRWWHPASWSGTLRQRVAVGIVAVAVTIGLTAWALQPEHHLVTVTGLDTALTFDTTESQLGEALKAQGIHIGAHDKVSPPLDTVLKGQTEITVAIKRAVPVAVQVDGQTHQVATTTETVEELLHELAITLGPNDSLSLTPDTAITPNMQLQIVRRTEQIAVVTEEIPYSLVRRDDRSMTLGETKEIQAGEPGTKEIRRVVYYEDGQEVGSEILEEKVVKEPVDQIVAYGTMGVVSRGGRSYRFTREITMEATGYTAGKESNPDGNGYTYTGMKAEPGVVAVDPKVIPLYSRLYIEGYGPAIAADIGGAIKGNKIDLCFATVEEALNWGRRPVTVYVLAD